MTNTRKYTTMKETIRDEVERFIHDDYENDRRGNKMNELINWTISVIEEYIEKPDH